MENFILNDYKEAIIALILFCIIHAFIMVRIASKSDKEMDKIYEEEIKKRINSIEHHKTNG